MDRNNDNPVGQPTPFTFTVADTKHPARNEVVGAIMLAANLLFDYIIDKCLIFGVAIHDIMRDFGLILIMLGVMGAFVFLPVTYYGGLYVFACMQSMLHAQVIPANIPTWHTGLEVIACILNAACVGRFVHAMHVIMCSKGVLTQHPYAKPSIYIVSAVMLGFTILVQTPYQDWVWTCQRSTTTAECSTTNAMYWFGIEYGIFVYILTVIVVPFWAYVDGLC